METNEPEVTPSYEPDPLVLNHEAQHYLKEAGKWANFLGIIGFIFCGLFLVFALFAGTILTTMSRLSPTPNPMLAAMGPFISVIYILIDIVYFFFVLYLFQFGRNVKKGVAFMDSAYLTLGLKKLKSFFKYWGILTIILLSLYALMILMVIVVGAGAATMLHR